MQCVIFPAFRKRFKNNCRTTEREEHAPKNRGLHGQPKAECQDVVKGLEAGADDYMIKPFDAEELRARVRVGFRVLDLQEKLTHRVDELEQALGQIKQLQGLLPICSYCKKIRDDGNYWQQVEEYIGSHSEVKFSHGICPACYEKEMIPQLAALRNENSS